MIPRDAIDRIREIPIADVLHMLGARRRGRSWYCLFHDDRRPSASVKYNRLRCFACSPDHSWSTIDVVMKSLDMTFAAATRWLANRFGISIPDGRSTASERRENGRRGAEHERDLRTARLWQRVAVLMAEESLAVLKAASFDPTAERVDVSEIQGMERALSRLRNVSGAALVDEYLEWMRCDAPLTDAMVRAAQKLQHAEARALTSYLEATA